MILGGVYILSASNGEFLGWISLIHLLVGALTFLQLQVLICYISLAKERQLMPEKTPSLAKIYWILMKPRVVFLLQATAICGVLIYDLSEGYKEKDGH